ncbi:MAG: leucine-rich repeat domain-containing protein [Muribaculaceae bacterium]|nr:leucine-rich repeat domain-containing protein [Muribaculaceae bacterium]
MKRYVLGLTTFIAVLLPLIAKGASVSVSNPQDDFDFSISEGEASVVSVIGKKGEMTIPSEVVINEKSYPVSSIGEDTFKDNETLKILHIPSSIKRIGAYAFQNTDLQEVYIESLESWCEIYFGFYYTSGNIYEYFESYSTPFSPQTALFVNGQLVKGALSIPSGIERIPDYAFKNLSGITSLLVPGSVKSIGKDTFYNCADLLTVYIEEGVENIESAFTGCGSLTEVTLPSSLSRAPKLGDFPLKKLNIPSIDKWLEWKGSGPVVGILGNGYILYADGNPILEVSIPGSFDSVRDWAFNGSGIESVKLAEGVTKIGSQAFSESSLESITLSESLRTIENNAFEKCHSLSSINFPEGMVYVGPNAFKFCRNLETITIPSSMKSVGDYAFCFSGIRSAILGDGVENINYNAFMSCSNLKEISLPHSLRNIEFSSFFDCGSLEELIIPEGVEYMVYALNFNESLRLLELPTTLTVFSESFTECGSLSEIRIFAIEPPECNPYTKVDDSVAKNCVLYVPEGSVEAYRNSQYWRQFENILETGSESGIETINGNSSEESPSPIYDLGGRTISPENLAPGIYIRDGKKFVVK